MIRKAPYRTAALVAMVGSLAGLVACGRQQSSPDVSKETATATRHANDAVTPSRVAKDAATATDVRDYSSLYMTPDLAKLGTSCVDSIQDARCVNGRVVVVRVMWNQVWEPPRATLLIYAEQSGSDGLFNDALYVAVAGDVLWARRLICGRCRRQMGFAWVVDVERLDAKTSAKVFGEILGLQTPVSTPPLGREEWIERLRKEGEALWKASILWG